MGCRRQLADDMKSSYLRCLRRLLRIAWATIKPPPAKSSAAVGSGTLDPMRCSRRLSRLSRRPSRRSRRHSRRDWRSSRSISTWSRGRSSRWRRSRRWSATTGVAIMATRLAINETIASRCQSLFGLEFISRPFLGSVNWVRQLGSSIGFVDSRLRNPNWGSWIAAPPHRPRFLRLNSFLKPCPSQSPNPTHGAFAFCGRQTAFHE